MNLIYECAEEVENFKKNFRLRNLSVEFGYVRMSGWAADMKCRIVVRTPGWVLRNVYFLTQLRLPVRFYIITYLVSFSLSHVWMILCSLANIEKME